MKVDTRQLRLVSPDALQQQLFGLSQYLVSHLEKQDSHVVSVTFLCNFGKDEDLSLKLDQLILKGVQVVLRPEYQLSPADSLWLHPLLHQTRSVFQVPNETSTVPNTAFKQDFNNTIGLYKHRVTDAIGMETTQTHLVMDIGTDTLGLWHRLLHDGIRTADAYTRLKDATTGEQTLGLIQTMSNSVPEAQLLSSSTTNMFCTNLSAFAFYNHAYRTAEQQHYAVSAGPLLGYKNFTKIKDTSDTFANIIPSDFGQHDSFMTWKELTPQQKQGLLAKCDWGTHTAFNPMLMRRPRQLSESALASFSVENQLQSAGQWTMIHLRLSPQPVHNALPPATVLALTPSDQDIVPGMHESQVAKASRNQISFDKNNALVKYLLTHTYEILETHPSFLFLNPEYFKGSHFTIPRHIVQTVVERGDFHV